MSIKLKQLAAHLGLSQTTVSRALNGYPEVNEDTRRRVLEAVRETGYRPNKAAQRLATGRAGSIGLVMPVAVDLETDMHFSSFLSGLAEAAQRHDVHLVINPSSPEEEEMTFRRLAASGNVDALFIAHVRRDDPRIAMLRTLPIPYLVHGRAIGQGEDYPFLDIDNERAFFEATQLLIELGHRRIGLINGPEQLTFSIRRQTGMLTALAQAGLPVQDLLIDHGFMTDEYGFRAATRFLEAPMPPTAILCSSTVIALGAVRALNRMGLKIGEDVSLIAHDDVLPLLKPEHFSVPLTTTQSSLRQAGARVAERLITVAERRPETPERELWPTELIRRASTGPAPRAARAARN